MPEVRRCDGDAVSLSPFDHYRAHGLPIPSAPPSHVRAVDPIETVAARMVEASGQGWARYMERSARAARMGMTWEQLREVRRG